MESRSWYEQEKAMAEITRQIRESPKFDERDIATQGNRAERRAQAAVDRRNAKRKPVTP